MMNKKFTPRRPRLRLPHPRISSHRPARTAGKLNGATLLALLLAFGVTKAQEPRKGRPLSWRKRTRSRLPEKNAWER
jgi:hypothetical protein